MWKTYGCDIDPAHSLKAEKELIGIEASGLLSHRADLYEAIYNKHFAQNNFPKKILRLNALERLEKKYTGAANKAPYLYRLNTERYSQLVNEEDVYVDY